MSARLAAVLVSVALTVLGSPGSAAHAAFPGGNGVLAFDSDRTGAFDVYTMNLDGTGLRNLTNSPGRDDVDSAWNPGGQRIAFDSRPSGGTFDVWVMNADGTGQTPLASHPAQDVLPTFCDLGTIIFASNRDGDFDLWEIGIDGSRLRQLANLPGNQLQAACRPDGERIAYASDQVGNFEVYEIGRDGSNPVNLTQNAAFDGFPDYSPTGEELLFSSNRDGNAEVFLLNLGAPGSVTQITTTSAPLTYTQPRFFPAGNAATATEFDGVQNDVVRLALSAAAAGRDPGRDERRPAGNDDGDLTDDPADDSSGTVQPNPCEIDSAGLVVNGSNGNDRIEITREDSTVRVLINGALVCVVSIDDVGDLAIFGNGGDDVVEIDADLERAIDEKEGVTIRVRGGSGNDTATVSGAVGRGLTANAGAGSVHRLLGTRPAGGQGGSRGVEFFGGPGNDRLTGGNRDDLFVGGPGQDTMRGGGGGDSFRAKDGVRDIVAGGPGTDSGRFDQVDRVSGVEQRR